MVRRGQEKVPASRVRDLRSALPIVTTIWGSPVLTSLSRVELITWQYSTSAVSVSPLRNTLEEPN